MFLVQKYGSESRPIKFYFDKYLRAFPAVLNDFEDKSYTTKEKSFKRAYGLRVFKRFFRRFGFVEILDDSIVGDDFTIKKTPVIDQIVSWNILQ